MLAVWVVRLGWWFVVGCLPCECLVFAWFCLFGCVDLGLRY